MFTTELPLNLGNGLRLQSFSFTVLADLVPLGAVTSGTVTMFTLPQRAKIIGVNVKTTVAFLGTAWSAATVSVGKSGAATRFTSAYDAFAAVADTNLQETDMFKSVQYTAQDVIATFSLTGGNANVGTAGALFIDVLWMDPSTPSI